MKTKTASKSHFPKIPAIAYEGPRSENPLSFKHYNPDEIIDGRAMSEHLRFAIAYWHSFRAASAGMFGPGTIKRAWDSPSSDASAACASATNGIALTSSFSTAASAASW